ncbi:MAG: TOBE domain-containing protein [Helicobacteraceae bacterium]|nr:TOBE domain-containing protein [Helicobacteraceae bacterium]
MNKIQATIISIESQNNISLVRLETASNIFSALILNLHKKASIGAECNVLFKENEVMVAHKNYTLISARNRFVSKVKQIETDNIFARITFEFSGTEITSLITKEASKALNIKVGEEFVWFVKSNEVALEFK